MMKYETSGSLSYVATIVKWFKYLPLDVEIVSLLLSACHPCDMLQLARGRSPLPKSTSMLTYVKGPEIV